MIEMSQKLKPIRINRKNLENGVLSIEPILRINRRVKNQQGDQLVKLQSQKNHQSLEVRTLIDISKRILVVIHSTQGNIDSHSLEVVKAAQILTHRQSNENQVAVLVLCVGEIKANTYKILAQYGSDEVASIDYSTNQVYAPAILAEVLLDVISEIKPIYTLFADSELFGSEILRRIIVQSDLSYATDVNQINFETLSRWNNNDLNEIRHSHTDLIGLIPNITKGNLPYICEARKIKSQWLSQANQKLKQKISTEHSIDLKQLSSDKVDLQESQFIVSAGNGVSDMEQFFELSKYLEATIGGSRVVVDDGKLARDKQIGLTGKVVQAQVYFALGISGAIQHLQGIENCQYVICVNQDSSCPMIKRSNLAVIADLDELIPELIEQVKVIKKVKNKQVENLKKVGSLGS